MSVPSFCGRFIYYINYAFLVPRSYSIEALITSGRSRARLAVRSKPVVDYNGYDIVIVLVNRFSKHLFLIPYYKNINTKEAA